MRPETPGDEWDQRILFLVIGILVLAVSIALLAVIFRTGSTNTEKPYFSKAKLVDKTINEEEETNLEFKIKNPTENDFKNVEIEIASKYEHLEIWRGGKTAQEEGGEYVFSLELPDILGGRESISWDRAVSIEGTLGSGLHSITAILEARIIADGEMTDSKTFKLKIKSAG